MAHQLICLSVTVLMLRVVPRASASLLLQLASDTASIPVGQNVSGQTGGGSRQPGGVDVSFAEVTQAGTFVAQHLSLGDLLPQVLADFQSLTTHFLAGDQPQLWQITFDGQFTGAATVALGFDPLTLGDVVHDDLVVLKRDDQTGLATGPHVCFRITHNGRYVDPTTMRTPSGNPVSPAARYRFWTTRDYLLAALDAETLVVARGEAL